MKGLAKLVAGMAMITLATMPGVASASPDTEEPSPPQPTSPFAAPGDTPSLTLNFNTGVASDAISQQSDGTYVAPPLSTVSFIPFSSPQSLVVYRGTDVIVQANDIGVHAATLRGDELYVDPTSLQPVWISNVGSPFGSAMGTALIAVHNVVRGEQSSLYSIGNTRAGDMVDVTLQSGDIMRFRVKPDGLAMPLKSDASMFTNVPRTLEVVICAPDGEHLYRLRAEQVL